jgi:plastocyanin domain-containing protein
VAAQLNAAAAGSATAGALGMLAFGLGTAPLMLGFGTASSFIPPRFKQRATVVLALVVMVFGVTYLNRGAMLLGSPLTTQSLVSAVTGSQPASASNESFQLGADGVVEIPLVIENVRFVPNTLTIPAGQPVRLVVDRREDNGCSAQLAVPQLGVLVDLAPFATTTVVLPAAAEGTYTLTCGMGMMSGQIRAVASGSSGASAPAPALESSPAASDLAACACCAPAGSTTPVEGSAVLEGGVQRITVGTSNGYEPNIIKLAAGIPAEITFKAGSGCMAQVMSDDLGFFQDLTSGDQTIPLPPLSPGEYGFSCGMRMVFGTIVVE